MATIRELDAVTIGQIAAGEIIERPASIVKELVENAIDAQASRITVNVERGGMDLIEVIDDGTGIASDDLTLAIRRHATSKLTDAEELTAVTTLGFRGEGLASIAAVAQTEVTSCRTEDPIGAMVCAHAEAVGTVHPASAPRGTRVRVSGLFGNVPVRREYLRSPAAEFNRISAWLSSFALAYPQIAFALRHDAKDVWIMPATEDERERLAMVFGREAARELLPISGASASTLDGALRGWVSAPGNDRPDRRMQLLFVNGRLLRSTLLAGAWTSAFSTYAMAGRHPYGVIHLHLRPHHVDPNVHPTKSDVRLRYGNVVFDAVRRAIAATLREHARVRFAHDTSGQSHPALSLAPVGSENRLRALAQIHRTYILASDGDGLLLIDQHAAHERIAYETIVASATNRRSSEPLLVPQVVELDEAQSAVLDSTLESLRDGGLDIEPFGEQTYRIVATPSGYGARRFELAEFLDDLSEEPKQREVRERVWASLACHSVTRAGETLAPQEMAMLLERLQACRNPMHCAHGRPTIARLGPEEIARMFKRA